jgi:hypothetical protein
VRRVQPSSEANPARGVVRRATLAGCGVYQGRDRVCALVSWVSPCFAFFAGFKWVSLGYFRGPLWLSPTGFPLVILGDPYGCPRQFSPCNHALLVCCLYLTFV